MRRQQTGVPCSDSRRSQNQYTQNVAFTCKQRVLLAIVPPLASLCIRLLGCTWRYRDVNAASSDGQLTPVGIDIPGPTLFAFWHQAMLACAWRFRNKDIAILISRSFDGELIARTVQRLGFVPIRGSSTRGGASAVRNMADAYKQGHRCAFTADGPKGPARVAKPGPIQVAQLTNAKWIGAYHAHPHRALYLKSWDRFMIPAPFTTITFAWPTHTQPDDHPAFQQSLDAAVEMCQSLIPNP
jgi:lysophospholipid acyltransferase (LPLAT)-like uncharacterized protein